MADDVELRTVADLEERLAAPSRALVADLANLDGDLLVLGAGGKMGPSLARLARNAFDAAGSTRRVVAVSRFSDPAGRAALEKSGVRTIASDLLAPGALDGLPDAENVVYMAAMKFGTAGREHETWATNALLPGLVARRYADSRIVAFSTGNVYPLVSVGTGGSREDDAVGPVGEYAQSCLGRERLFEYASHTVGTRVVLFRLNYAVELRYGTIVDIALAVRDGSPIDLATGHLNAVWQGDANEAALRSLHLCSSPPTILNYTGPETLSVRRVAEELGALLDASPVFEGVEAQTALLSNASRAHGLLGYPRVPIRRLTEWVAAWVADGGATLGKPTKYGERSGRY